MSKLVYLIAGEASGDFLGAQLIKALRQKDPSVEIIGIGGSLMEEQGLKSLFPMQELSVMGVVEILPQAFKLLRRIRQTVQDILSKSPDVVVTIDSPGFCMRVAEKLKKKSKIPVVHYVAPSVWAWRPGRAKKMVHKVDHLLTLFPFEPKYFTEHGLMTTFVGHPLVEQPMLPDPEFRKKHGIPEKAKLVTMLPGSRIGEIKRLLPIFRKSLEDLSKRIKGLHIVVPTLEKLVPVIKEEVDKMSVPVTVLTSPEEKYAAFYASNAALAASGTVSLELALTGLPMVIAYKLSPLTYLFAKALVKTPYACLVNILLQKRVVSEKLQEECNASSLTEDLIKLLSGKGEELKPSLKEVEKLLRGEDLEMPSEKAAKVVLTYC